MKKRLILVFVSALSLMMVTGCTSKVQTLNCNKTTEDSSGFKIEENYYFEFNKNNIKKFEVTTNTTPIKDELKEFIGIFSTTIDEKFESLKDKKGIDYNSEVKDNKHSLVIKIDYDKIDLEEFDDANDDISEIVNKKKEKSSIKETKKDLENDGYKCSIE